MNKNTIGWFTPLAIIALVNQPAWALPQESINAVYSLYASTALPRGYRPYLSRLLTNINAMNQRALQRTQNAHSSVASSSTSSPSPQPQTSTPLSAPTAFQFIDLYAFPNPTRGGQAADIRVQVGLADSVDIHIYDISGRLIKTTSVSNPLQLDDGNGKGLQYTFDYLWNTSSVGSGVYIYAITAHKAGQSNISRIKKLAVIR